MHIIVFPGTRMFVMHFSVYCSRSHLEDSIETSKELRKEVAGLQGRKSSGDKQFNASDCSLGNGDDTQGDDIGSTGRKSAEDKLQELRSTIASCALRPQTLGKDIRKGQNMIRYVLGAGYLKCPL